MSTQRQWRPIAGAMVISIALMLSTSCTCPSTDAGPHSTEKWVRTELYFGLSRPDGTVVSDKQWAGFLTDHVTVEFPEGLTVVDVQGQWRDARGITISEPSRIVILFHPGDSKSDRAIDRIREAYAKLFNQESILRADSPAQVDF